jgi:hypothetical protein
VAPGCGPSGYHRPLSIPQETAFKFVSVREGQAWSQPQAAVTVANLQSGALTSLFYPGKSSKAKESKPDPKVMDLLKSLKPGDVVNIKGSELDGHHVLTFIDAYKPKVGEDEPGVFVFKGRTSQKIGAQSYAAVNVSKYFQSATVLIPHAKDASGKMVPDAALSAEIAKLNVGDAVFVQAEVLGQNVVLRAIQPYQAPLKAEFVKYTQKKANDDNSFALVDVKTDSGAQTMRIPSVKVPSGSIVADAGLVSAASSLKAGQTVEYRARTDSVATWVVFLRPAAEQPAKADQAKTEKVADAGKPAN